MGWGAFVKTCGLWCRPGWQSQGLLWLLPMVCVWGGRGLDRTVASHMLRGRGSGSRGWSCFMEQGDHSRDQLEVLRPTGPRAGGFPPWALNLPRG